jgi:hypothetical protein
VLLPGAAARAFDGLKQLPAHHACAGRLISWLMLVCSFCRHKFFNTNNLWVNLRKLKATLEASGALQPSFLQHKPFLHCLSRLAQPKRAHPACLLEPAMPLLSAVRLFPWHA